MSTPAPNDALAALQAQVRRYESVLAERDAVIAGHEASIAERDAMIEHLQEQVRLLLAQRFAPSSEKMPDGQLGLFNEAEASAEEEESESVPDTEVAAYRRGRPKRAPLPEYLPRVDIVHALPDSERTCPHHAVELERFGEVVSEQLDIIPAKVQVLCHIRGKYRCPNCEGHLRTAPMPAQPLAKSFASPGLLSFIATAKYADALPLYRQHQQLQRIGVELSRTTLARWMVGVGELVVPLINVLRDELLDRPYLLMDETTVQVLKEPGKAPESKSQLWAQMRCKRVRRHTGGRVRRCSSHRIPGNAGRRESNRAVTLKRRCKPVHRVTRSWKNTPCSRRGWGPAADAAQFIRGHADIGMTPWRMPSARLSSAARTGCSAIPWPAPTQAPGCTRSSSVPRRTGSNPTPTCATHSPSCPRHNRSPTSKPCCRLVSTPPPWPTTHSKGPSPHHVNNALCGALTEQPPRPCARRT